MALDKDYFDSINIDVVKKKYYNAGKVDAVLSDIKAQALSMASANASMRSELNSINSKAYEVGDAIISANALARRIVAEAEKKAASIIDDAEKHAAAVEKEANERCERLSAASEQSRELLLSRVESSFSRLREYHLASIEMINEEWRSLLCALFEDADIAPGNKSSEGEAEAVRSEQDDENTVDMSDIDARINAILNDINDINRSL